MDPAQRDWLEEELRGATSSGKIAYFHHPLYSDGRFHGPDTDLRASIKPLFEKYAVNVVLSGHEHVYERINPQHGIYYFILGNAGELRYHNLRSSPEMAAGFDEDRCFTSVEIAGDEFYFHTITRTGKVVDPGVLERQPAQRVPQ
ncbi:MAG: metallophosphoesterase [Terriglobia bacterium]